MLFSDIEEGRSAGVIVFDPVHGRSFSEDEIKFCSEVAELLSLLLGQERIVLQCFRNAFINRVEPLGGFAGDCRKTCELHFGCIKIIRKEATEIDCILPSDAERRIVKEGPFSGFFSG